MPNPASLVTNVLKRQGQVATIIWDTPGLDVATPSTQLSTYVYIETSKTYQAFGQTNNQVKAMLPITDRDLTGARLAVGTINYQILSVDVFPGAFQEVIMSCL